MSGTLDLFAPGSEPWAARAVVAAYRRDEDVVLRPKGLVAIDLKLVGENREGCNPERCP